MKNRLPVNWTFVCSIGVGLVAIPFGLVEAVATPVTTHIVLDQTMPGVDHPLTPIPNGGHIQVINENDGKASVDNLFYSFSHFSIGSGDTAYFNLIHTWQNVISRVTGGQISYIDGTLRVSGSRLVNGNSSNNPDYIDGLAGATTIINGAKNFYFINPAGIVFGNGSVVDVPGSFYASTASTIKFANPDSAYGVVNGVATTDELSSANPVSFGFLGNETGAINLEKGATIQVFNDETLALVGHDINIDSSTVGQVDLTVARNGFDANGLPIDSSQFDPNDSSTNYAIPRFVTKGPLFIDGIQLLLLANHGKQDVGIFGNDDRLDSDGLAAQKQLNTEIAKHLNLDGTINISNTKLINAGGDAEEITYIRGGNINLNHASVVSSNYGDDCAGLCASNRSEEPTPGPSGIDILATGKLTLNDGHIVTETSFSPVNPADNVAIKIQAASMLMDKGSTVSTRSLNVANIDPSYIPAGIVAIPHPLDPKAGDIKIKIGADFVAKGGSSVESSTETFGDAGKITIDAGSITLNNASIKSESLSNSNGLIGYARNEDGNIQDDPNSPYGRNSNYSLLSEAPSRYTTLFTNTDSNLKDINGLPRFTDSYSGFLLVIEDNKDAGAAGSIALTAHNGNINLTNSTVSTNIVSGTQATEPGAINLAADSGSIIMNNSTVSSTSSGDANAGNINITFRDSLKLDPSAISTTAVNGNGGNITIGGGDYISLQDSEITTSVTGSQGNGGNINISSNFLIMDSGFIQANTAAQNANGGLVNINVGTLLPSGSSVFVGGNIPFLFQPFSGINVIQAAAPGGLNGQINATAPQLNLSGTLATLIVQSFDPAAISRNLCAMGESSSLAQSGKGGLRRQAKDGLI